MAKLNSLFPQELNAGEAGGRPPAGKGGPAPQGGLTGTPHVFVQNFIPGQEVDGIYLVQEATIRAAKNGSKYIQASVGDRTGQIPVRQWDATDKDLEAYKPSGYARVRGRIETYQGRPQMIAFGAQFVEPGTVDPTDYLPVSARPVEEMARELDGFLAGVQDADYKRLLDSLFGDASVRERFLKSPAASSIHHAWVGGLLEHVLSACQTAEAVARQRPFLNRDLLLTGVLLHDIGKIEELDPGPGFAYTDSGRLCGHIALGSLLVERHIRELKDFPAAKRNLILHMILSHHGEREHGSPVTPCTGEAVALHHIECLDAKVQGIQTIIEREQQTGQSSAWSDFARVVDGRIFKDAAKDVPASEG